MPGNRVAMVSNMVINTLRSLGIDVTDLGLATTPTVEMAVTGTQVRMAELL